MTMDLAIGRKLQARIEELEMLINKVTDLSAKMEASLCECNSAPTVKKASNG
jgi:hypothetical protein